MPTQSTGTNKSTARRHAQDKTSHILQQPSSAAEHTAQEIAHSNTQMNYALEDLRLRALSASRIPTADRFNANANTSRDSMCFYGEPDIYNITPLYNTTEISKKKVYYCYQQKAGAYAFELTSTFPNGTVTHDILVDGKFRPDISFFYNRSLPVNFIFANLTLHSEIQRRVSASSRQNKNELGGLSNIISKIQGVRFWYATAVNPNN